MEEKIRINDSKNNSKIYKRIIFQRTKENYATIKPDVYRIDDIWCLDIKDLKDYGLENNRGYRYFKMS